MRQLLDAPRQVRNETTGELAAVAGTPAQADWFYWWLYDALRLNRGALRGAHGPAPRWRYPDWSTTPDTARDRRAW